MSAIVDDGIAGCVRNRGVARLLGVPIDVGGRVTLGVGFVVRHVEVGLGVGSDDSTSSAAARSISSSSSR